MPGQELKKAIFPLEAVLKLQGSFCVFIWPEN